MKKRTLLYILFAAVIGGFAVALLFCRRSPPRVTIAYEPCLAQRSNLIRRLRENGSLFTSNPVLVKNTFRARLKWIVEQGVWVEKGDTVFITHSEDRIEAVAKKRAELITLRQELRLARLRRKHTEDIENLHLDSARRRFDLEQVRYRILTSRPKAGRELIDLHEALVPLEATDRQLNIAFESAQDDYLAAQDAYLAAQDAFEAVKNDVLRNEARIDELSVACERDPATMQPVEREKHAQSLADLDATRKALAELQKALPAKREEMVKAQNASDKLARPLRELETQLKTAEVKTRDLYIRLEIEKRGLELAQLQFDEAASRLRLEALDRDCRDADASFAAGAISRMTLDDLAAKRAAEENQLKVIRQKVAIASRPPAPEELAEAKTKLAKAEAEAVHAREKYDQALAVKDAAIEIVAVQIRKLEEEIRVEAQNIPEVLEANIVSDRRELQLLAPEESERRAELDREIAALELQLVEAKKNPPHIYKAPVSGIVRLKKYGDRGLTKVGDEWWEEDAVVMIYPPGNLEVFSQVNEVNARYLRPGMPATVLVPALGNKHLEAKLFQVAAIAKDKFSRDTEWHEKQAFAGVNQFEVRARLLGSDPGLRQGMTVTIEIEIDRKDNALWIPAAAVIEDGERYEVRTGPLGAITRCAIAGAYFNEDCFLIFEGISEGEKIWIERRQIL